MKSIAGSGVIVASWLAVSATGCRSDVLDATVYDVTATVVYCGNGRIEADEVCDDGDMITNGEGGCVADCSAMQVCGDGSVDGTEACDDGDVISNGEGGCLADCSALQVCGDDAVNGTEVCDDGDAIDNGEGGCLANCSALQVCGDSEVDGTEACDDGDSLSNGEGACVADCSIEQLCGDDSTDGTETCDDGDTVDNGNGGCLADCSAVQVCGDSVVNGTEGCDDGDAVSNGEGACIGDCSVVQHCGDVVTQGTEGCDDGNANDADACRNHCMPAICGDGVVRTDITNPAMVGYESCDTGPHRSNTAPNTCRKSCLLPYCGDGVIDTGETCDDGNATDSGNGCSAMCQRNAVCGDGLVQSLYETCDDAGPDNDDACPNGAGGTCQAARCGDIFVQASVETCDDGNDGDDDACPSGTLGSCLSATCGDGIVRTDITDTGDASYENCDDGNTIDDGNGCAANCRTNGVCGDGTLTTISEQCDNGAANSDVLADSCRTTCQAAHCGDGVTDSGEGCDDGNAVDTDACRNSCAPGVCGDGIVRTDIVVPGPGYEQCDRGVLASDTSPDTCRTSCLSAHCGDGVLDTGETCDDGNATDDGNGCSATCTRSGTCGDGILQSLFEACDDGDHDDTDDCPDGTAGTCQPARCGDGALRATEGCDDGNDALDDACPSGSSGSCVAATCGDGFLRGGVEACDDGDTVDSGNGCAADCTANNVCGDGAVDSAMEQCDNGAGNSNTVADACRTTCIAAHCGDGVVDSDEACDDGNTTSFDGCAADCSWIAWETPLAGPSSGALTYWTVNTVNYVGGATTDGTVFGLDATTGVALWETQLGVSLSIHPTVSGNPPVLFVPDNTGVVHGVVGRTGEVATTFAMSSWSAGSALASGGNVNALVAIDAAGTMHLLSFSAGTGLREGTFRVAVMGAPPYTQTASGVACSTCWPTQINDLASPFGAPVLGVIAGLGETVTAWNVAGDCAPESVALAVGEAVVGPVIFAGNNSLTYEANDMAYAATNAGRLLQLRHGETCGTLTLHSTLSFAGQTPSHAPLAIYVPTSARAPAYSWARWLVVVTEQGGFHLVEVPTEDALPALPRWSFDLGAAAAAPPAVDDYYIAYVGDVDGVLHAIDLVTQAELWTVTLDGPIVGSPLVSAGAVYVATMAGTAYAIEGGEHTGYAAYGAYGWSRETGSAWNTSTSNTCSQTGGVLAYLLLPLWLTVRRRMRRRACD